ASVCARAAGETDLAPLGAMGGLTQIMLGGIANGSPGSTLFGGGVVSGAATQTSQMMWSFKAGHLLGASPRRQIVAQCAGAIVGVAVAVPVFALIVRAYGLGTPVMPAAAPLSWKVTAEAVAGGASAMPRHAISAA